jgi:hypothetical protein
MTELDLTKSKMLLPLLKYITDGLSQLNTIDPALHKVMGRFRSYMLQPSQIMGEELIKTIDETKEIVSSYEIKAQEGKGETTDLPNALYNARTEVENLMSTKKLEHPEILQPDSAKIAELVESANNFYSLAAGKDVQ